MLKVNVQAKVIDESFSDYFVIGGGSGGLASAVSIQLELFKIRTILRALGVLIMLVTEASRFLRCQGRSR